MVDWIDSYLAEDIETDAEPVTIPQGGDWVDSYLSDDIVATESPTQETGYTGEYDTTGKTLLEGYEPTPTDPDWGFDFYERTSKSFQETFGAIWGGVGAMASSVGMEGARDWAIERSNTMFEKASNHDIISTQFKEISNPIDFAKFGAEKIIEYFPDLVMMAAGGAGVGTAAAKIGGKKAAIALAKKSLKSNYKAAAKQLGEGASTQAIKEMAYKNTMKQLGTRVGMAGYEGFQGAGQMYMSDVELRGADEASAGGAFLSGAAQSAIAMVSPFNKAMSNIAIGRGVKNVGEMTIGEAVEEILQGGIEKLHEAGIDPYLTVGEIFSDPETYIQLAEAGVVGALVGGAYGGAGRVVFGSENSDVQDPEGDLVEESATPKLTADEQIAQDMETKLTEYYRTQAIPGTAMDINRPDTTSVLTAGGVLAADVVLPEVPTKTAEELLAEYEGTDPIVSQEAVQAGEEALTAAYEPTPPQRTTVPEQTEVQKFEAKAKEDTRKAWFDRFAPATKLKKKVTTEMKELMGEVEEDTNNLPKDLVERKKAREEIKKKVAEVVKQAETPPTEQELSDYAAAQKAEDLADAMANVQPGVEVTEKTVADVQATEQPTATEQLEEEAALPETDDPHLNLILENDVDGLIKEIDGFKNPPAAFEEIARKAGKLVEDNPAIEQRVLNVLKQVGAVALKREGAAQTGAYQWKIDEGGIPETTNPATGEVYRAYEMATGVHVLVDSNFNQLNNEKYKTSLEAREALETLAPIEEKVKVKEQAKRKATKKAEQKKKKSVKVIPARVPKGEQVDKTKTKKVSTPEDVKKAKEAASKQAEKAAEPTKKTSRIDKVKAQTEKRKTVAKERTKVEKAEAAAAKKEATSDTGYPILDPAGDGFVSLDGNYVVNKVKDGFVVLFKGEQVAKVMTLPSADVAVRRDAETRKDDYKIAKKDKPKKKELTKEERSAMMDKADTFFDQFVKVEVKDEKTGGVFTPTTLGKAFEALKNTLTGNQANVLKAILTGARGKFEKVVMHNIAEFPKDRRDAFDANMAERGYTKDNPFRGGAAPVFNEAGEFTHFMILYDSRNMTDAEIASMTLHEGLHVVTINELESSPQFRNEIEKLRKYVINLVVKDQAVRKALSKVKTSQDFAQSELLVNHKDSALLYGLINNQEFVTNAVLEPAFRKKLNGLKSPRIQPEARTVWAKFKQLLGRILGINRKEATLLDDVFGLTKEGIKTVPTKFIKDRSLAGQYTATTIEDIAVPEIDESTNARIGRDRKYAKDNHIEIDSVRTKWDDFVKSGKDFFSAVFQTTSERLRTISPKILNAVRKFEFRLHRKNLEHIRKVDKFISNLKNVSKEDEFVLTKALMNGDTVTRDKMLTKYNLTRDFSEVQGVLDDIQSRMDKVGLLDEEVKDYFPRSVRDVDGLIAHFNENPDDYGFVQYEIDQREKKLGYEMSETDKNNVITDLLMTGNYRTIPRPGASKNRNVNYVPRELVQYYHSINDTLLHHLTTMNEAIEAREMLGRSKRPEKMKAMTRLVKEIESLTGKKEFTTEDEVSLANLMSQYEVMYEDVKDLDKELEQSIAEFIKKEAKGAKDPALAIDLIRSRLKQKGTYGAVSTARNIAYSIALGSPTSAITQIGDLTWSIYRNGPIATMKGAAKAIRGMIDKNYIARNEFDFAHALHEMSDMSTNKMLDKVLTWTGLKGMDIFAKETAMQSTLLKWQGDRNGFIKSHSEMFGGEIQAAAVWQDIKKGNKTEDVLLAVFNDLSDWQPISLSEMPQAYLTAGNGRVFYMLKTFSIKALNAIHREVAVEFKAGNYNKAAQKLVGLMFILAMSGAAADELKDVLLGKESSFQDNTADNFWQLILLNKYNLQRGLKSDTFVTSIINGLLPPVRFGDDFVADLYSASSTEKDFKFKSLKDVPIIGKVVWSHAEYGRASELDGRRSDIYTDIRDTVSGPTERPDVWKEIREFNKDARKYNKGKTGDDRIKPITNTNFKNVTRRQRKKEKE